MQNAIVDFWRQAGPARWYAKDEAFDQEVRARFLEAHESSARGELWDWESEATGALALILLLDQFPRNLFRGSAHSFATDSAALEVAQRAIAAGRDRQIHDVMRQFFYLPFMHAENLAAQERCIALFEPLGEDYSENLKFARLHRDIIASFGRYPHRNGVLGRKTTLQEQAFLDAGGFAG